MTGTARIFVLRSSWPRMGSRERFTSPSTIRTRRRLPTHEIRTVYRMGMEIGSHTLTHRLLTGRAGADVRYELSESKMRLEDILGAPITAFSYPQGAFIPGGRECKYP